MKNKLFTIIGVIIALVVLVIAVVIPGKKEEVMEEELLGINYNVEGNDAELNYDTTTNPVVALYIEKYGSIVVELYPEIAPNTVNNFISLVKKGFYDNNSFHRLMPGFVLQGGDPTGTGSGGPGYTIRGEFDANGFTNPLKHEKGVISMARTSDSYDTAGSQFFLMLDKADHLDGNYASFGKIIAGEDLLEKIVDHEKIADTTSGKLQTNLVLKKALVDLNDYYFAEPEIITE